MSTTVKRVYGSCIQDVDPDVSVLQFETDQLAIAAAEKMARDCSGLMNTTLHPETISLITSNLVLHEWCWSITRHCFNKRVDNLLD